MTHGSSWMVDSALFTVVFVAGALSAVPASAHVVAPVVGAAHTSWTTVCLLTFDEYGFACGVF